MKTRKIPLRKCTGCLEMKDKKSLIRIVKSKDDNMSIDLSGKMAGRGAYVCKSIECLQKAYKNKGLERSFKCKVSSEIYEHLKNEMENLENE